jgi:hypothetical protein
MMTVQQISVPAALRHCDPMALVKLMQQRCQGCGCEQRHGWALKNGRATCPRCGFVASVKAKVKAKAKAAKRRPPAPRPAVIDRRLTSTPRPRAVHAQVVAASGRDGNGERDDGGGDGDGDGGGGDGPAPPRLITAAPSDRDRAPLAGGAS